MTEMRDAIIFVGVWRPPMPPPSPDATILNYFNARERTGITFCRILPPPPPPKTPQYLTILMTERRAGVIIFCRILAPLNDPPPPDATILHYLNDRESGGGGALFSFVGFWRPPSIPRRHLLTILMAERGGGALISCKKLNI